MGAIVPDDPNVPYDMRNIIRKVSAVPLLLISSTLALQSLHELFLFPLFSFSIMHQTVDEDYFFEVMPDFAKVFLFLSVSQTVSWC